MDHVDAAEYVDRNETDVGSDDPMLMTAPVDDDGDDENV